MTTRHAAHAAECRARLSGVRGKNRGRFGPQRAGLASRARMENRSIGQPESRALVVLCAVGAGGVCGCACVE